MVLLCLACTFLHGGEGKGFCATINACDGVQREVESGRGGLKGIDVVFMFPMGGRHFVGCSSGMNYGINIFSLIKRY